MSEQEDIPFAKRVVHFVFGAIFGGFIGVLIWFVFLHGAGSGWVAIPVSAIVCGLLAALFFDRFWSSGVSFFDWW